MDATIITMSVKSENVLHLGESLAAQSANATCRIQRLLVSRIEDTATREAASRAGWETLPILSPHHTYAEGHNLAVKQALGNVLVFISDDALLLTPQGLERLIKSPFQVTGTLIVDGPDKLNHAGHKYHFRDGHLHSVSHEGRGSKVSAYLGRGYVETTGVTFACVAIKRSVWDVLHGLDEQFRWGCEDCDFCIRAVLANIPVGIDTDQLVFHREHGTRKGEYDDENTERLRSKWRDLQATPDTPSKWFQVSEAPDSLSKNCRPNALP